MSKQVVIETYQASLAREEGRREILDKLRKLRDEHGMRLMVGSVDMTEIFFEVGGGAPPNLNPWLEEKFRKI